MKIKLQNMKTKGFAITDQPKPLTKSVPTEAWEKGWQKYWRTRGESSYELPNSGLGAGQADSETPRFKMCAATIARHD